MATLNVQPATFSARKLQETFFQRVPADLRYVNSRYNSYLPVNSLGDGSVDRITFNLPSFSSATFYDMSSLLVEMTVKIVDENGNIPAKSVRIANICGASSFFSDVKIYLNDVLINPNSGLHHFKSYLKTLLSFSKEYKSSVLGLEGYGEDTAGKMQAVHEENQGFTQRLKDYAKLNGVDDSIISYNSEGAHYLFNLNPDLQSSILNGISIRLELTPNDPKVCLFGKKVIKKKVDDGAGGATYADTYEKLSNYKFLIKNIVLHALCHDLRGEAYEEIQSNLKKEPASLSFRRFDMLPYIISKGVDSYISDVLFPSSQMVPSRAFFFLVPSEHFTGDLSANPFDFQLKVSDANIKRFFITLGGQEVYNKINANNLEQSLK